MVGMEEVRQPISGQTTMNIVLNESTGYPGRGGGDRLSGSAAQTVYGASENVKMSDIKMDGLPDVGRVLEGRVAGG